VSAPAKKAMSPQERVRLAQTYFEDGACFSAARVLRELADDLEAEGRRRNVALLGALLDPTRQQGKAAE
jgi:hypothetical protein